MRHDNVDIRVLESPRTTSIRNEYFSEDRERRKVTLLTEASPFTAADVPPGKRGCSTSRAFFTAMIPVEILPELARRYPLAVDAQGLLRRSVGGSLAFRDLADKGDVLRHITYLKTDAAEAEVLTGEADREKAARIFAEYGPREE
jgi:sugar/nucleoside kinase (ribokinase family)